MELRDVFVGRPSVLGTERGTPVLSAISKAKVAAKSLELTEINLDGDDQADRTVHGGVDKAVYVYPAEHYAAWASEGFETAVGDFGENLSVTGADEDTVRIGDVWSWGDALLQVCQPRTPCFKLAMKTARKDVIPGMIDSGRSGWYLRVLRPGEVPTSGVLALAERADGPTLTEVSTVAFANVTQLDAERRTAYFKLAGKVLANPDLSAQYRHGVRTKVERWETRNAR
ncbi:MOSC domain-containing protein [Amycolatopsis sp. H20-H5]|uniref:MOSC domain-containing protein n=1 Tax=Amycolatopsis sp. H20-H5 TaxID=3046309 RepID=UPI002DBA1715|nr:MOSC domain-containing protein [Amycolatopsis sp. H20-H5]MEC3982321.1 MOSC domain-containing protein [Amycolatopsis sp. H20-H5]